MSVLGVFFYITVNMEIDGNISYNIEPALFDLCFVVRIFEKGDGRCIFPIHNSHLTLIVLHFLYIWQTDWALLPCN